MDPFLSALGIGIEAFKWIKNIASKKVVLTPKELVTTSKHWDSTSSLIVQNVTNKPLFDVQIVCWFSEGQEIEFRPQNMQKTEKLANGISVNTALNLVKGVTEDEQRSFYLIQLSRLLPLQNVEIDLQIKSRGIVKFEALSFQEQAGQILKSEKGIMFPFKPTFNMKVRSFSLWLSKE